MADKASHKRSPYAPAVQYKFIVDGEWKYAPDQPAMHDERGIINNVVEVQEYVPDHLDSLIGFEPPPSPPERCGISTLIAHFLPLPLVADAVFMKTNCGCVIRPMSQAHDHSTSLKLFFLFIYSRLCPVLGMRCSHLCCLNS